MWNEMRKWRRLTWAIWVWCLACAVWVITGLVASENCSGLSAAKCAESSGQAHGLTIIIQASVWMIGFLILCMAWFMTRPGVSHCRRCGEDVILAEGRCQICGTEIPLSVATRRH